MNKIRPKVLDYALAKPVAIAWRALAVELLTLLGMIVAFLLVQFLVLAGIAYLTYLWA